MTMTQETEERKFLHDVAGPVGTAIFLLDILLESMNERADMNADDLAQVKQVFQTLEVDLNGVTACTRTGAAPPCTCRRCWTTATGSSRYAARTTAARTGRRDRARW